MSPDLMAAVIWTGLGFFLGAFVAVPIMGALGTAKAREAEKEAWAVANRYYTAKGRETS